MSFIPTEHKLGYLPLKAGETATYEVSGLTDVNTTPSEIMLYAYITLKGTASSLQRGYYIVYTKKLDGTQFKFYMNFAMTNDTIINSENFWLPYGQDFEPSVYVTLIAADGAELQLDQHPCDDRVSVGEAFITGYRA